MVIIDGILTQLPAGYRFDPTDEELMKFYLTNKVFDRPVPGEVVKDIDANELYSNSPNAIVNFTAAEDEKREWYFFIHHRKHYKKEQEKEKNGMAGNGLDFWTSLGDLKKEQEEKEKHQMGGNGFGFWSFQEEQEKEKFE
ncbi:hypothetical protein Pfo_020564 [Paulownia fortunei]|nr:hypothetical protein Pfo_020564 [Paulownia fortunei]